MGRRGGTGLVVSALLAASVMTGCSDGSGASGTQDGSGSPGTQSAQGADPGGSSSTAYPSGTPTGAVLTEPGTELPLASGATVSWQPRQDVVGTLRMSVDRIERTTFQKSFVDWKVDAKTRTYTPYFVHAHVSNVGDTGLGGVDVPLYGESAANALVEPSVFKETFKPCHPSALPKRFPKGASTSVCLVYLVPEHGALVGAAFRPTEEFDPIVWKGDVVDIAATPKGRRKGS
jgi:hypothetical protein